MNDEDGETAVLAIFAEADTNGDGKLDPEEFEKLMKALDPTLTADGIMKMKKAADKDDNGSVEVKEFVHWVFTGQCMHTGEDCKGAAHVKKLVHQALHQNHAEAYSDDEFGMLWNQAQKAGGPATDDGHVSVNQVSAFLAKITECEDIVAEFLDMWHDDHFPFATGPGAKAARKARGWDPDDCDDELLDKEGFILVMHTIDD